VRQGEEGRDWRLGHGADAAQRARAGRRHQDFGEVGSVAEVAPRSILFLPRAVPPEIAMNRTASITLTVAVALAMAGCGDKKPEPKAEKGAAAPAAEAALEVKIGHVGPLTGGIAHLGKDNENGARLAVEEANAAG